MCKYASWLNFSYSPRIFQEELKKNTKYQSEYPISGLELRTLHNTNQECFLLDIWRSVSTQAQTHTKWGIKLHEVPEEDRSGVQLFVEHSHVLKHGRNFTF
jgi:hypothetical protein